MANEYPDITEGEDLAEAVPPPYTGPLIYQPPVGGELPAGAKGAPGPQQRVVRTVKMQVLALIGSIPVAIGALTAAGVDVDPQITAIAVGVPTAAGVIVAAVWNLVDAYRGNG